MKTRRCKAIRGILITTNQVQNPPELQKLDMFRTASQRQRRKRHLSWR
jgi:hypothetical protein